MKVLIQLAFAATALASAIPAAVSDASPLALVKRAVSPDGTCGNQYDGNNNGYTCPTGYTKCCSEWGWCGDSSEHCGAGCQSGFGSCTGGGGGGGGTDPNPPTSGVPYGAWIYGCTVPGKFALSFDDGPYDFTSALLDTLSSRGVKATFFLNGQNWGAPITDSGKVALVQRMINEGHQVGSHTWSHPDLSTLSDADIRSQMNALDDALRGIIGKRPTYMRPPYFSCGSACLSTLGSMGYHVINTNLDTNDWQGDAAASKAAVQGAIAGGNPGSNSWLPLLHDVHSNTVNNIVPDVISYFQNAGYTSATVGECLGDAASNWYA